jgi:RNA polymerase-binding transcription factor DksA
MDSRRRNDIEKRLLRERSRVLRTFERLDLDARSATDDGDLTSYPLHLADEGTDAMEKEKDLALLSSEGRMLYEIDDALRRLYRDPERFGECERCGRAIEAERLELVPWARLCVTHKGAEENTG